MGQQRTVLTTLAPRILAMHLAEPDAIANMAVKLVRRLALANACSVSHQYGMSSATRPAS